MPHGVPHPLHLSNSFTPWCGQNVMDFDSGNARRFSTMWPVAGQKKKSDTRPILRDYVRLARCGT